MAEPARALTLVEDPYKAETEEAVERLAGCKRQKQEFDLDLREGYFFTAPHRAREIRSDQALNPSKPQDADTLQTGLPMELATDFGTEMLNSFMPQAVPWAQQRPGMLLGPEDKAQALKLAGEQDPVIFDAIRASNLYEEVPKAFNPDLSLGTAALHISDPRPSENIVVQAIPLHELEINVGPWGSLDDRFVRRHTKYRHVKALLGSVYDKIEDDQIKKDIADEKKRQQTCILSWGYWRQWDRHDDVVWKHVVMLNEKVVHAVDLIGEGSCPLLPFRFNASPEWAYGQGPTLACLPDFRQIDELEAKKIEHVDRMINPPMTYPDDSMSAIEGGVESGKFYPVRPGSEKAIQALMESGSMEPAIYEMSEKERSIRRRHYLDLPQQRGDTPPTATQWLDEMEMAQRRIGTPGASFWREGPAEFFLRFKFLLARRGVIEPVKVNGKIISLQPYNPAQRAAEQQEVAMFTRFAQIGAGVAPEEWKIETDGGATLQALADKMRVNGLWKRRSTDDKQAAVAQIAQLMQGQQGQVPPGTAQ